jgi:urease accessory protein
MICIEALPETPKPSATLTVPVPMTSEDRARVRRRFTAPDGLELALALPTGTKLAPGQILHEEGNRVYIVEAAPERVLVIEPRDAREAAFAGHLVGNMHRDIDLEGDGIAVLYDEVLEARLLKAHLILKTAERPFHGNAGGGHSH